MRLLTAILSVLFFAEILVYPASPVSYEYWIDNEFVAKETGAVTGDSLTHTISVSGLSFGVHWLNYRLIDEAGNSGGIYRRHFYVMPNASNAAKWQYWFDNDKGSMQTGDVTSSEHALEIDLAGFTPGLHFFSYRYGQGDGNWGGIYRRHFYVMPNNVSATKCQYWIDDDKTSLKTDTVTSSTQIIDLDLTGFTPGVHFLNYRYGQGNEWGGVYRKLFVIRESDGVTIKGYCHYLNGTDSGYVEQVPSAVDSCDIFVDIPKEILCQFERGPLRFSGDKVMMDRWGSVNYRLQLRSEFGWGSPTEYDIDITDTLTVTAVPMRLDSSHTFNTPCEGEFVVAKFASMGEPVYFKSDFPVVLDIYQNGKIIKSISASQMRSAVEVNLADGEYLVVLHDAETDSTGSFTLQLNAEKRAEIIYDGRYLSFDSGDADTEIIYSFNGDQYSTKVKNYDGIPIDVSTLPVSSKFLVSTHIVKDGLTFSIGSEYSLEYCGGDEYAWTSSAGQLMKCYEWDGGKVVSDMLTINGCMDSEDYYWLLQNSNLRSLDITNVENPAEDGTILDSGMLAMPDLVTIAVPKNIVKCSDRVFGNISKLCAVILPAGNKTPESLFDGVSNPNLIVYNHNGQTFSETVRNRFIEVKNDEATDTVVLKDGYPFYSPNAFNAPAVRFVKEFKNETGLGTESAGWESIVLPFAVQTIENERGHRLVPFKIWNENDDTERPFWLYRATADDWQPAEALEAGVPYIISMPNNPEYIYNYNLNGIVTFCAENVVFGPDVCVPLTSEWKDGMLFRGIFMPLEETDALSLNVNGEGGALPGSTFTADATTLPFGAYVVGAGSRRAVSVFGDTSDITLPSVSSEGLMVDTSISGTIRISSMSKRRIAVNAITGATVADFRINAGETIDVGSLPGGVYIVAGMKVMVK